MQVGRLAQTVVMRLPRCTRLPRAAAASCASAASAHQQLARLPARAAALGPTVRCPPSLSDLGHARSGRTGVNMRCFSWMPPTSALSALFFSVWSRNDGWATNTFLACGDPRGARTQTGGPTAPTWGVDAAGCSSPDCGRSDHFQRRRETSSDGAPIAPAAARCSQHLFPPRLPGRRARRARPRIRPGARSARAPLRARTPPAQR